MQDRKLFHVRGGGVDLARLIEQLIPTLAIGAVVVYANSLVTQAKVDELSRQITANESERRATQVVAQTASDRLIALQAQVTAYLAQQTQLNAAMDARLTYIERAQRNR